ncbi:hypothetical protein [Thalassospira marina]|uniref:hypothetical protein n=1 Tax=Thalassospira marina TaxID=2048283 RepID=UPI0020C56F41|nr:hypothetical protein [Thalassospira marina]
MDDRKKENLLAVIRRYTELAIQPVITLIGSDLQTDAAGLRRCELLGFFAEREADHI